MNRNLKFAIAAAILGVTGQAHAALTAPTSTTSGSLFLYAFEDRSLNSTATNTAIFDLGLASNFNTTATQTFNFSADSAWTSYVATIANPANIKWGVFGSAYSNGGNGTKLMTTMAVPPASVNGTAVSSAITHYMGEIGTYGSVTSGGFNAVTTNDLASSYWANNAGGTLPATLTTGLGSNLNFYQYTSTGTKATSLATQTAFNTAGNPDYFTLSSNGVLTYTAAAPVPEADTYALMLSGLGLVGYMVRRRKAA